MVPLQSIDIVKLSRTVCTKNARPNGCWTRFNWFISVFRNCHRWVYARKQLWRIWGSSQSNFSKQGCWGHQNEYRLLQKEKSKKASWTWDDTRRSARYLTYLLLLWVCTSYLIITEEAHLVVLRKVILNSFEIYNTNYYISRGAITCARISGFYKYSTIELIPSIIS